jgi:hypothetical protein
MRGLATTNNCLLLARLRTSLQLLLNSWPIGGMQAYPQRLTMERLFSPLRHHSLRSLHVRCDRQDIYPECQPGFLKLKSESGERLSKLSYLLPMATNV